MLPVAPIAEGWKFSLASTLSNPMVIFLLVAINFRIRPLLAPWQFDFRNSDVFETRILAKEFRINRRPSLAVYGEAPLTACSYLSNFAFGSRRTANCSRLLCASLRRHGWWGHSSLTRTIPASSRREVEEYAGCWGGELLLREASKVTDLLETESHKYK